MKPLTVCPNGVLRDGLCLVLALPEATYCPGGFTEYVVDGMKECVSTRVARMKMACWGPHEKLEGDLCIEVRPFSTPITLPLVIFCILWQMLQHKP